MKRMHREQDGVRVHVKGRNLTVTPALHDLVVAKLQRLDKYFDRLHEIDVELWTEQTRDADQGSHVEATTHVSGQTIRVGTAHKELYAAVDEAVDKLYRQLNRRKERVKAHHGTRLTEYLNAGDGEASGEGEVPERDEAPSIVAENPHLHPLFDEEAVEEMEAQGRSFLVFLNARNERVNVLYRRDDGNYGLIEPRVG